MTVLNKDNPFIILDGNNSGVFTFNFRAFRNVPDNNIYDIKVSVWSGNIADDPLVQVQGQDFTVTLTANETGQITFSGGRTIPTGTKVIIESDLPYTQEESLPARFSEIELALDRLAMEIKQLAEEQGKLIAPGFTAPDGFSLTVANPLVADKPLVLTNPQGNRWEITTSSLTIPDLQALVQQAQQAATDAQTAASTATSASSAAQSSSTAAQTAATTAQNAASTVTSGVATVQQALNDVQTALTTIQTIQTDLQSLETRVQALASTFPDPTGQPANKVLITDGNNGYTFGSITGTGSAGQFVELVNAPAGYTVTSVIDLTGIDTTPTGDYNLLLDHDATGDLVSLKYGSRSTGTYGIAPDTILYQTVSDTTPLQIATASLDTLEVYIGNRFDKDLYLSADSADLAANPTQGIRIPAGAALKVNDTTDLFLIAGDGTGPATNGEVAVTTTKSV